VKLLLDGNELPSEFCTGRTVSEVLGVVAAMLSEHGRVILDARLDGAPLEDAPPDDAPGDRLEITSGSAVEFTVQSLRRTAELLPQLAATVRELGKSFLATPYFKLQDDFSACISNLREFFHFLGEVQSNLGVDSATVHVGEETLLDRNEKMVRVLEEIILAFASKDFVKISDLMQYEVAPALEVYAAAVPRLIELVEDHNK